MRLTIIVFTVEEGKLLVMAPGNALPVFDTTNHESLDEQAQSVFRRITSERNISSCFFEQLYTFSFPAEAGQPVVVSYYFLLPSTQISSIREQFTTPSSLSREGAEGEIIRYAVQRLRWKIEYTNVIYSFLPEKLTLGELQKTYEAILGRPLDKRNFRKKILSLKLLMPNAGMRKGMTGRGAQLYRFRSRTPVRVKVF